MPSYLHDNTEEKMIAYCGLDCSKCLAYIATQADDDRLRVDCASKWSTEYKSNIKPESINCDGCKSDGRKFSICHTCGIRKCASEKGVDNCSVCEDYACRNLKDFWTIAPSIKTTLEALRKKNGY